MLDTATFSQKMALIWLTVSEEIPFKVVRTRHHRHNNTSTDTLKHK